jgi:hypothetical protein
LDEDFLVMLLPPIPYPQHHHLHVKPANITLSKVQSVVFQHYLQGNAALRAVINKIGGVIGLSSLIFNPLKIIGTIYAVALAILAIILKLFPALSHNEKIMLAKHVMEVLVALSK